MCKKLFLLISVVLVLGLTASTTVAKLVAYYPLDEGSGTTALDASGNGHDGAIQGTPTYVDSQTGYGKALYFNGVSPTTGWVDCGRWNPSEETGQLSVAFWTKWDGPNPGNWQGLVAKRDGWAEDGSGSLSMWEIEIDGNSNVCQFFRGGSWPG
ncbi:MAG: hypothetical protein ACYS80_13955, partial [Planctomycetota bacterium]